MTELQKIRAQGVIEDDETSYTYRKPADRKGDWLLGDLEDITMHARTSGACETTPMHLTYSESFSVKLPVAAYQVTPVKYNTKANLVKFNKGRTTTVSSAFDKGTLVGLLMGVPFTAFVCIFAFLAPPILALTPIVGVLLFILGATIADKAVNSN